MDRELAANGCARRDLRRAITRSDGDDACGASRDLEAQAPLLDRQREPALLAADTPVGVGLRTEGQRSRGALAQGETRDVVPSVEVRERVLEVAGRQ